MIQRNRRRKTVRLVADDTGLTGEIFRTRNNF
jgi:hypothetical protein